MNKLIKYYRIKIILIVMCILSIVLLSINISSFVLIRNILIKQMSSDALGTAISISSYIELDLENYKNFVTTREIYSPYHKKILEHFKEIKDFNHNIKYIYTTNRINLTQTEFILDSEFLTNDKAIPGFLEKENSITLQVFNSGQPTILPLTDSLEYGFLIGGSAPIFENDKVIGVVGVDIDIGTIYKNLVSLMVFLVLTSLIILIISFSFLWGYIPKIYENLMVDKLTHAFTKKHTEKLVTFAIKNSIRENKPLSAIMLDLDSFKNINDSYGHQFGDVVLNKVSSIIYNSLREQDIFIRFGGDEFFMILVNLSGEQALEVGERIRTLVVEKKLFNRELGREVQLSVSLGITELQENQSWKDLIEKADKALFKAKQFKNTSLLI